LPSKKKNKFSAEYASGTPVSRIACPTTPNPLELDANHNAIAGSWLPKTSRPLRTIMRNSKWTAQSANGTTAIMDANTTEEKENIAKSPATAGSWRRNSAPLMKMNSNKLKSQLLHAHTMPEDVFLLVTNMLTATLDIAPTTLLRKRKLRSSKLHHATTMPRDANLSDIDMFIAPLVCAPTTPCHRKPQLSSSKLHATTMPRDAKL